MGLNLNYNLIVIVQEYFRVVHKLVFLIFYNFISFHTTINIIIQLLAKYERNRRAEVKKFMYLMWEQHLSVKNFISSSSSYMRETKEGYIKRKIEKCKNMHTVLRTEQYKSTRFGNRHMDVGNSIFPLSNLSTLLNPFLYFSNEINEHSFQDGCED